MARNKKNIKKIDKLLAKRSNRKLTIKMNLNAEGGIKLKLEGGQLDPLAKFMLLMGLDSLQKAFHQNDKEIKEFLEVNSGD